MKSIYTIRDLYEELASELSLSWNGGGAGTNIVLDVESQHGRQPAGPLNIVRPNQIQIIGPPERDHLINKEKNVYREYLQVLFNTSPAALIFTDGLKPLQDCKEQAMDRDVALFYTTQPDNQVIKRLVERFSQPVEERLLVHGVYMEVMDRGVL
ncbi:MAG: HPr(Ser) kinase/phosphatase, partial [Candidatus Thiodiazotropha sp.]